jgi:hypothetical protein
MASLLEEAAVRATEQRRELRSKDWQPSHNTKARFDRWGPTARGAALAALVAEAAADHHAGRMPAAEYRAYVDQVEAEAKEHGVQKEFQAALAKQLDQGVAGEAIRLLESFRRQTEENYHQALAQEARARVEAEKAEKAHADAKVARAECEKLIEQLDASIAALVRA